MAPIKSFAAAFTEDIGGHASGDNFGFLLKKDGTFKKLPPINWQGCHSQFFGDTYYTGRNNLGDVVGYKFDNEPRVGLEPFVLSANGTCKLLPTPPDTTDIIVSAINNHRQIVGGYSTSNANYGFILNPSGDFVTFKDRSLRDITDSAMVLGFDTYGAPVVNGEIELSESSLRFLLTPVNEFSADTEHVEVRNLTKEMMVLSELMEPKELDAPKVKITTSCGLILGPGQTCGINVAAAPSVSGRNTGTLTFTTTALNSPHAIKIETFGRE